MQITETHKSVPCGSKGRLTIKSDSGEVLAVIMTPVQKARKYCEDNPETPQGVEFALVLHNAAVAARKAELGERMEELEAEVAETSSGSTANRNAVDELLRFQNENADELLALGLRQALVAVSAHVAPASSVPYPPVLSGANPENTALVSAQRKLAKLHEAAQGADPIAALSVIKTSRGNKYLNTCDDYRSALLAHFGQAEVARG